ncbi:hypothetical protein H0H93_008861 [Arthromyces matolae]|nr:hypothetical protein H0H93_008861 [Arthromyces matolae]
MSSWRASTNALNPFTNTVGPGFVGTTCQLPQITDQGLQDALTHGQDLRAVYASRLGLSSRLDPSTAKIRVTNNQITSQVASGLVKGLFPGSADASSFDSLEPAYSCNKANSLKNTITSSQTWSGHYDLTAATDVYTQLDAISGIATQDTGGWHSSFDQ